jgi:hypothetical protein
MLPATPTPPFTTNAPVVVDIEVVVVGITKLPAESIFSLSANAFAPVLPGIFVCKVI